MAVEKSYARLGLFLVIAIVVILATGLLFIQRMRSREVIELVTYTQENVAGLDISSPVRYRGVPVGQVSNLQVEPGGRTIEIDFELFTDRLTTIGANVTNLQELAKSRVFRADARSSGGQPRDWRGIPLSRRAGEPPPPMTLGFTPSRPYVPSMPTPIAELRDRLPEVLERVEATLQVLREIVARMPDSLDRADRFFTNVERIVRESELPASAPTRGSSSRRPARRSRRSPRTWTDWSATRARCRSSPRRRAAIDAADLPASGRATREAMDQASLAAGGCGARCPRCASRSGSCASSRASCRNSRSRWSTASSRQERSRNDSALEIRMLVLLAAACLGVGCRVRIERPDTVPTRMIEPRLVEPAGVAADAPNATSVRLLETQGRGTSAVACTSSPVVR